MDSIPIANFIFDQTEEGWIVAVKQTIGSASARHGPPCATYWNR